MDTQKSFHESIAKLISHRLKKFNDKKPSPAVCLEIYTEIFNALVEVLESSPVKLTNESVNYVAQSYYDGILINNVHELDPNIFTQRASVKNISTKELAFLAVLLKDTDFRLPLVKEIKQRS